MIKVCGITNLEDALAAVDAGVDAIGFNFYRGSKRYIAPETVARIAVGFAGKVLLVGVFVNEPVNSIERIAAACRLDIAQLHGDESPDMTPGTVKIWKAYRVQTQTLPNDWSDFPADTILLDGPAGAEFGGSGQPFLWSIARGLSKHVVLAGGLDAANVAAAIEAARPWGVDACSRLESAPGIKDHKKMREFVDAARAAEGVYL